MLHQPGCRGYVDLRDQAFNNLMEQSNNTAACFQSQLWRVEDLRSHPEVDVGQTPIIISLKLAPKLFITSDKWREDRGRGTWCKDHLHQEARGERDEVCYAVSRRL